MDFSSPSTARKSIFIGIYIFFALLCVIGAYYFPEYEYILVAPAILFFGYIRGFGKGWIHGAIRSDPTDGSENRTEAEHIKR